MNDHDHPDHRSRSSVDLDDSSAMAGPWTPAPGKAALTDRIAVQRKATGLDDASATLPRVAPPRSYEIDSLDDPFALHLHAYAPAPRDDRDGDSREFPMTSDRKTPDQRPGSVTGSAPTTAPWQRRDPVDPIQYQTWCDDKLAAMMAEPSHVQQAAASGVAGPASALPHGDAIQASFGHHDVSRVQAHVGGAAADASAQMGAQAYATGNQVAFAAQPDLRLAAHEAAHVVQQRGGVQLKGGVGRSGDAYEQHADAVADIVVRGESAERLLDQAGSASAAPMLGHAVQRFGSTEHKTAADEGSGNAKYQKAGMALTHGDLAMLRGDYFAEDELLIYWRVPSAYPGHQLMSQDEVIYAMRHAVGGTDPRFAEGGAWHGMEFSSRVKKAVEDRYAARASENFEHFLHPGLAGFGKPGGIEPGSSAYSYRDAHERAIKASYQAGTGGGSMDDAMITEAMGQHFLTDSFAAGHATTQRGAIQHFWDSRYPHFTQQFADKLVRDLSAKLADQASKLSSLLSASTFEPGVRAQITEALASQPAPTIGKLLGLVAHDFDNANGLWFTNDLGWKWFGGGDGHMDDPSPDPAKSKRRQRDVVTAAVTAGCDDVRTAYALGQTQKATPVDSESLYSQVRQGAKAPATPRAENYAPEQFLPKPAADEHQGEQAWHASSIEELWDMQIRPGKKTWGDLIEKDMQSEGTIGKLIEAMVEKQEEEHNPFPDAEGLPWLVNLTTPVALGHGHIHPRRAFREAVVNRLQKKKGTLPFLLEVLSNK